MFRPDQEPLLPNWYSSIFITICYFIAYLFRSFFAHFVYFVSLLLFPLPPPHFDDLMLSHSRLLVRFSPPFLILSSFLIFLLFVGCGFLSVTMAAPALWLSRALPSVVLMVK